MVSTPNPGDPLARVCAPGPEESRARIVPLYIKFYVILDMCPKPIRHR